MPQVKVWNDNDYPHTEKFKGEQITIPSKKYVYMDFEEALEFKGSFTPIIRDGSNNPTPQSFKRIRIEGEDVPSSTKPGFQVCPVCRFKAFDDEEMEEHTQKEHGGQMLMDDNYHKAQASKKTRGKKDVRQALSNL